MSDRHGIRPPRPGEMRNSLAAKLVRVVDRARQLDARVGNRPYRVFLVWTKFTGEERGEGTEAVVCRQEILPVPVVSDLTSVALSPFGAGIVPLGSVRVTEISAGYSLGFLTGKVVPGKEDQVPQPYDFFYEVVEDDRHDCCDSPQVRPRYRLMATPFLDAPNQQWKIMLERTSGETGNDGKPLNTPVVVPTSPWDTRQIQQPPEDD